MRNETTAETLDYLRGKYGDATQDADAVPMIKPLNITIPERYQSLNSRILDAYKFRSPYLASRGITEAVQRLMNVGFDRNRQAVTLPWANADGSLGNVKYRRINSKAFFYEKGGRPIREMVYGIDVIYRRQIRRACVVEAEIDALTLMSAGIPAIATGGSGFSEYKRDLIAKSPLEEVVLFRDNDSAGRKWRNRVVAELAGLVKVRIAYIPSRFKDVNEYGDLAGIARIAKCSRTCRTLSVFQLLP